MMKNKESMGDMFFRTVIVVILVVCCIAALYPFIYVISASMSNPLMVMRGDIKLWPKGFTLMGYESVFGNSDVWMGYKNTVAYTVVGTSFNVIMTSFAAFPLSRRDFQGRRFWMFFILLTMFFSGGLIPVYILIQKLHLYNTFWVMIIPFAASTWNIIIMRTFIQSNIPDEIQEAAIIDGANDLNIFVRIILPLCKPIIAVMILFYGVENWNQYFRSLIYLQDRSRYPLSLILREILIQQLPTKDMNAEMAADQKIIGESIRYALIVVATLPVLFVYPFAQKYFVKGALIGSIKG